jgi:uncharacterized repeat protein (TIGR03803 family)
MRARANLLCAFLLISAIGAGAATYHTIHSFTSWGDGQTPFAGVVFDHAGNLYGVTPWAQEWEGVVFELSPSAGDWQLQILHQFDRYEHEGAGLIGGLVFDEAGNLYGTTSYDHNPDAGCGSVFKLSRPGSYWTITYLRYFYWDGAEGCDPEATLTYSNGMLWGTTQGGGSAGQGTVFSMDTSGGSFQFFSFTGKKGSQPRSAFNLWGYGTTYSGGAKGKGNIYRLDPANGLVSKRSLAVDGKSGYAPMGDLLTLYVGGVRTIYGTTSNGGAGGSGTVYRLTETQPTSDHWRLRVLHSFSHGRTGRFPMAGLTADPAGNLYGTTSKGGKGGRNCGTVFKLSPGKNDKWTYTTLYSFDYYKNWVDGCRPNSGVVLGEAGNLYGTTMGGGEWGYGTVYEIIP